MAASFEKTPEQQRRIRRNVVLLALLALGFYVAFITLSVLNVRG